MTSTRTEPIRCLSPFDRDRWFGSRLELFGRSFGRNRSNCRPLFSIVWPGL